MSLRPFPKSVRARITLWHLGVLILTTLFFMLFSHLFLWNQLRNELDSSLQDDFEIAEDMLVPGDGGKIVWRGHEDFSDADGQRRWIEARLLDGRVIFRNFSGRNLFDSLPSVASRPRSELLAPSLYKPEPFSLPLIDDGELRVIQGLHHVEGEIVEILVSRSQARIRQEMIHLLLTQAFCLPLVILIAWCGGYFLAGRLLTPLQKITEQARAISAERLHERLAVENPEDELGRLSITINDMLAKLDHSFSRVRQFTADASHELRTPLAAIRSVGEIALRSDSDLDECRETIASILEEVERMTHLVEDLLVLARADNMVFQPKPAAENLRTLAQREISLFSVLAEEKDQVVHTHIEDDCPVFVDQQILRLGIGNILSNAIKFTPAGKEIRITLLKGDGECCLDIADSGPGIEKHQQPLIFDRFYRINKDRCRATGGIGLGLAIAKWAIEVNGGRIELSSDTGCGSVFRIRLPLHIAPGSSNLGASPLASL